MKRRLSSIGKGVSNKTKPRVARRTRALSLPDLLLRTTVKVSTNRLTGLRLTSLCLLRSLLILMKA